VRVESESERGGKKEIGVRREESEGSCRIARKNESQAGKQGNQVEDESDKGEHRRPF